MAGFVRWEWVQIDCADPLAQCRFWSELLGYPIDDEVLGDPPHYAALVGPDGHPNISFQRVPEGKTVKNRIHLDVRTDDLEKSVAMIAELGGRPIEPEHRTEYGATYHVMADPEGNEFCLVLED
jgi:predicted enzyme related to lactoylglutathione lyase